LSNGLATVLATVRAAPCRFACWADEIRGARNVITADRGDESATEEWRRRCGNQVRRLGGREMSGQVVVNRSMSLDGFIAGPGDAMDWIFDFVAPDEFPEIAAATGAMLIGRRTYEVGSRMAADQPDSTDYPFSGPVFVLTHEPPEPPDPEVTFLTGDIGEAVTTARSAAGGKNLEILGADVAGQCLRRGLVDEILVYVLPVLLGDGIRFSSPGLARIDLEPVSSTRAGAVTILRFRVRN
jgi:dihydrofolate reductase